MPKEEVLSLLLTAGEPVSGEHICRQLGVTRAAVWKAIDQLRQAGYTIEAAPRRGDTAGFLESAGFLCTYGLSRPARVFFRRGISAA